MACKCGQNLIGTFDGVAGLELRLFGFAGAGELLLGAAHDSLAAHPVKVAIVAVQLSRAGDA